MRPKCVCIDTILSFNVGMVYEYIIHTIPHKDEKFRSIAEVFYEIDTKKKRIESHSFTISDFELLFSITEYRNMKIDEIINPSL